MKGPNDEKDFIHNCPYKGKKCGDNKDYNFKHLYSYCNQCYIDGEYNIKNGRWIKDDKDTYTDIERETNNYKEELANNCKFGKDKNICYAKDFLEICQYCNKKFSRKTKPQSRGFF